MLSDVCEGESQMKNWLFLLLIILSSCGPTKMEKSGSQGVTAGSTDLISKISLQTPSPSSISTPSFFIQGNFLIGDTVTLHSNSTCTSPIGNATAQSTYSVNITSLPLPQDGTYVIYANVTGRVSGTSGCSTVYSTYQYQTGSAPARISVLTPSGASLNPIVSVGEIQQGASVSIFTNANCNGSPVGAQNFVATTFTQIQTTLPPTSQDGPYTFWVRQDYGGKITCSAPSNTYTLNTKPGYLQVLNPSPGMALRPTVRVGNGDDALVPGSLVKLYQNDPTCSTATFVGEKQSTTNEISVDITTITNLPADGIYTYYATQAFYPPGSLVLRTSPCSLVYGTYNLDTAPTIALSGPTPSYDPLPIFRVSGLVPGAEAQVYLESLTPGTPRSPGSSGCGTLVGSAISTGQIAEVKLSSPLPAVSGNYTFYAKQVFRDSSSSTFSSSCSTSFAQYQFEAPKVFFTSPNPGNVISPTLAVTSLSSDASNTVTVFPSDNCTGTSTVATATLGQFTVSIPIPPSAMPTDGAYFFSAKQSKGLNPSVCLGAAGYALNTKPNNFKNVNPAAVSGNIATPTFSVSNIASYASGTTVTFYKTSDCSGSSVGSSSGTAPTVNVTLSAPITAEGTQTYYAKQTITGHTPTCSTESVNYTYNITPSQISVVGSSSGNDPSPTIRVGGVVTGGTGTVQIWKGSTTCETLMGSAPSPATATFVDITSNNLANTDQGPINYFAKQIINGVTSSCSTAYTTYNLNTYLTSVKILTGSGPKSEATGSSNIPAVQVEGFAASSTVQIFSDSKCSAGNLMGQAIIPSTYSSSTVTITSNPLNFEGANYYYARQLMGSYTGPCSNAFATYNLNSKPQTPVLLTASPGTTLYPAVSVSNIIPGALIELFVDNKCSVIVGSQLSSSTQVNVQVSTSSPLLVDGTYYFYVRQVNNGHQSPCSDATAPYELNTTPTGISVVNPPYQVLPEPTWNIVNPTIQVSGVVPGSNVVLYKDPNCTTVIGSGVPTSTLVNIVVQNGAFPTDGKYALYVRQSYAGHTSYCSGNTTPVTAGEYNLVTRPTLDFSTTSPNNFLKPSVKVKNTVLGAFVQLYSSSTCDAGSEISNIYLSTGGDQILEVDEGLTVNGLNKIYSKQAVPLLLAGLQQSPCSLSLNYDLLSAPTITTSTPSPSSINTPSFTLSNLFAETDIGTKTVAIYSDSNCTNQVSATTTITSPTMTISVDPITRLGTSTLYAKQSATDPSFTSPCSNPGADYNYDLRPAVAMVTPSPNDILAPTVRVSNIVPGATVTLFNDSSCSNSIESFTGVSETMDLTLASDLPSDGPYKFYANQNVAGTISECSSIFASYSLATNNYSIQPAVAGGTSTTPVVNVSGIDTGDIITLYADGNCSTVMSAPTTSPGTSVSITSNALSPLTVNHQWWAKRQMTPTFTSPCTGPSGTYVLNIMPSSISLIGASPGTTLTPTFQVNGVNANSTVTLYTTGTCSANSEAGSAVTGASSTSVLVSLNPPMTADGNITVWARQLSNGNLSPCSTASASYVLNTGPTSLTVTSAGTSNPTPVINVSGVQPGATVNLYVNDPYCSTPIMGTNLVPNSATSVSITSYPLVSDGNYTYYAKQFYPNSSFVSGCSISSAFYPLNSQPTSLKLLSTNPTSSSTPRILVEGVSSSDWVYLFQDAECKSVSGSNISTGSSVQIQTLPALTTTGNYTYYAKRIQGGGQGLRSGCSTASVSLTYDPAYFSNWQLTNQLVSNFPSSGDEFGTSVSTVNNYAVVGVPGDNGGKGIVYLYYYDGYSWSSKGTLTTTNVTSGDAFGYAVDLFSSTGNIANGDVLIVGAPGPFDGTRVGKAFVFTYQNGTWVNERQFTPSGLFLGANFGASVAINGNMAIVGAPGANSTRGTVRYFGGFSGVYTSEAIVDPPASVPVNAQFGFAVAVNGTNFVVSAPLGAGNQIVQFYTAPSGGPIIGPAITSATPTGEFGYSLDLSENVLIIGAPNQNSGKGNSYVHSYVVSGLGVLTSNLVATLSPASTGLRFGEAVSIYSNSLAVVGQLSTSGTGIGNATIYPGPNFSSSATLPNVSSVANDKFGASVGVFGGSIIVGAPGVGSSGDIGASYLYRNDQ